MILRWTDCSYFVRLEVRCDSKLYRLFLFVRLEVRCDYKMDRLFLFVGLEVRCDSKMDRLYNICLNVTTDREQGDHPQGDVGVDRQNVKSK